MESFESYGRYTDIKQEVIFGGVSQHSQTIALRNGVDVLIATPGRLLDLMNQGYVHLDHLDMFILDEADRMLDMGFIHDVKRIIKALPARRQTMLFSATMPGPIITLARTFLNQPTHVRAEENDAGAVHERTEQFVYRAHALDKTELLARALQARERGLSMIFTRTKRTAQKVADELVERGFAAAAVHGDLGQGAREQALRAFRSGKIDVLVATDVAARGIDVEGVTHVINYQCPEDEKTYVHRIGRTGRAGRTGVAVTLVDWDETPRWKMISDTLDLGKPDPVETYSTSDHLFSDLDIPAGSTGRLPLGLRTRAGLGAEPEEDLKGERKSRGRRRGKGAAPRGDAPAEGATAESGSRTPRRRRRSRGGVVDAAEATEVAGADVAEAPVGATEAAVEGGRTRRRKPAGAGAQAAAEPAAEQAAEAVAGPAAEGSTEPADRTRTRRRKADATADVPAEGTTGPATAEGTAEAASGATGDEGSTGSAGRTRTRRRKAATTPEATPEVAAEANAEVTAGAAEVAAENTPEGAQEGPAKRTRRRKPAEVTAEGAEAAERPRRRKAPEASPEAGAERPPSRKADAPDAEDSDERPRRRRRRRTGAEAEGSADALPSAD